MCPELRGTSKAPAAGVKRVSVGARPRHRIGEQGAGEMQAVASVGPCQAEDQTGVNLNAPIDASDAANLKFVVATSRNNVDVSPNVVNETAAVNACSSVSNVVSELSALKYVDVSVTCDNTNVVKNVVALCDSGAEICCVKSALTTDLSLNVVGEIQLGLFCGPPVEADLVCLAMSFGDCDRPKSNAARSIHAGCAVVPDLHDNLILTDDAFRPLTNCSVNVSHVADDNADDDVNDDHNDNVGAVDDDVVSDGVNDNENVDGDDVLTTERNDNNDLSLASSSKVAKEQRGDKSLICCWKLAEQGCGGFVVKDNLLYHRAKILGQPFLQLVVPSCRRQHVLKMGHDTFGGHMSIKRTKARIY